MNDRHITDGRTFCFFAFDVANSIDLSSIPAELRPERTQIVHRRPAPEYVEYVDPPVEISLGTAEVRVGETHLSSNVTARLFDFGAVSISFALPAPGRLGDLPAFAQGLATDSALAGKARRLLEELMPRITGSLNRPGLNDLVEDYYVFHLAALDPPADADTLLREHGEPLAGALSMDAGALSRRQIEELLRDPISWSPADLVLADWNAAVIHDVDPPDSLAALESLNVQLVELRFLDLRLDQALATFSSEIYRRGSFLGALRGPHRESIRRLSELMVETSRLSERVQNALKLIPDVYLARVHRRGSARLGLETWESNVRSKLDAIRHLITALSERSAVRRGELLELTIIFLIALEIGLALLGWMRD